MRGTAREKLLCFSLLMVSVILPLLLTGCGGQVDSASSETMSASSGLSSEAKTDLGRRILEDGEVSAAEWNEIKQVFTDCIHEKVDPDSEVTWYSDDSSAHSITEPDLQTNDPDADQKIQAFTEKCDMCAAETDYDVIASIVDLGSDPDKDTTPELVQCLISEGLVDQSMTVEEYKQIISDPDRNSELFGKYTDSSNPDYDEQKARDWKTCQESRETD